MTILSEELFIEFRNDSKGAFEKIFEDYYPVLVVVAYRYTLDEQIAEEIAADSLLKVYQLRGQYLTAKHLYFSLFKYAKNSAIDTLRKKKNKKPLELDVNKMDFAMVADPPPRPDIKFIDLIVDLPPRAKEVLYLLSKGLSYGKIAQLINTTAKNVENMRAFAIKKIRYAKYKI